MPKNKESSLYIFTVAITVSLICATLVAVSAVALRGKQYANAQKERKRNILVAANIYDSKKSVDKVFSENIEPRLIDLTTGEFDDSRDIDSFDEKKAKKDPETSIILSKQQDKASIGRMSKKKLVYLKKVNGKTDAVILPIHGYGLWGTMYGF